MQVTERDRQALEFIGKWRFATAEQLIKAGIFSTSIRNVYNRLLTLKQNAYVKSNKLPGSQIYYYLSDHGGAEIGLDAPYWNKAYKDARVNIVLQMLTAADYALAAGVDYLTAGEVGTRLSGAKYDTFAACLKSKDRFYEKNGKLYVLIIDYQFTLKSVSEKVRNYTRLPGEIKGNFEVVILTFSAGRQQQLKGVTRGLTLKTSTIKANWKY